MLDNPRMNIEKFRNDFLARRAATKKRDAAISQQYGVHNVILCHFAQGSRGLSFSSVVKLWPFVYGQPFPSPPSPTSPTATEGSPDAV